MRTIVGLKWARACLVRPKEIPVGRPRGRKALGVRYEREVARALAPCVRHGLWWEFEDREGHGWCQTDLLLAGDGCYWVGEVKYSWTEEAERQLAQLYQPVLGLALGAPIYGFVVTKNVSPAPSNRTVYGSLKGVLDGAACSPALPPVLHWLGLTPLLP